METKHGHSVRTAGAILLAPFYVAFLAIASLFALGYSLLRSVIASRRSTSPAELKTPSPPWMVLLDGTIALGAYLLADVLRCAIRQHTSWPEHLDGYGSTLGVHLVMMAGVPVAWTLLLAWIGWYRPVPRTLRWKATNTIAASILLALFMGTAALVFAREAYPRMQIVYFGVTLPIATGIVRGLIDQVGRRVRGETQLPSNAGPAW